jgi:micrococcal nuclease
MRRGWWTGVLLLAAVVALLVFGTIGRDDGDGGGENSGLGAVGDDAVDVEVVSVTDGDTIDVLLDGEVESVRYIGIDTPESNPDQPLECYGDEASNLNEGLVADRTVRLSFGPERRDDYGRLLAYVHAGDTFVNAELVRRGFARSLTISPNDGFAGLFERLEAEAGRAGIGLWGACAE